MVVTNTEARVQLTPVGMARAAQSLAGHSRIRFAWVASAASPSLM